MVKSKSQLVAGEEFVEISALPFGQSSLFSEWLTKRNLSLFQINAQDKEFIRYELYDHWFESFYKDLLLEDFDA